MSNVDIYIKRNLYQRYCAGECWYKKDCTPTTYTSGVAAGYDLRVVGKIAEEECPAMARVLSSQGWMSANNHGGRCGYESP